VFGEYAYSRGDVFTLKSDRTAKGHEQRGHRFAVILQADSLLLSSVVVAPTSTKTLAASFRPQITIEGRETCVLVEQMSAIDPEVRLGRKVTHLSFADMHRIGRACAVLLDL